MATQTSIAKSLARGAKKHRRVLGRLMGAETPLTMIATTRERILDRAAALRAQADRLEKFAHAIPKKLAPEAEALFCRMWETLRDSEKRLDRPEGC